MTDGRQSRPPWPVGRADGGRGTARAASARPGDDSGSRRTMRFCFELGFLFSVFGLITAAIIAGEEGARKALNGLCWAAVLTLGMAIVLVLMR